MKITDDGLRHLQALGALKSLYLRGCQEITDDGLRHLQALSALTNLDLSECEKIMFRWSLKSAMPQVSYRHSPLAPLIWAHLARRKCCPWPHPPHIPLLPPFLSISRDLSASK